MRAVRDQRGVVYAETLVAFMPIFIFFIGTLQIADESAAHLIVEHASTAAARAAVVVLPDDGAYYGDLDNRLVGRFDGVRRLDVERAADTILAASPRLAAGGSNVTLDKPAYKDRDDLTATVRARYHCFMPLFCPNGIEMGAESSLVYQGASYIYEFDPGFVEGVLSRAARAGTQQSIETGTDPRLLGVVGDEQGGRSGRPGPNDRSPTGREASADDIPDGDQSGRPRRRPTTGAQGTAPAGRRPSGTGSVATSGANRPAGASQSTPRKERAGGAQAAAKGEAREARVAELVGGKVSREPVKTRFGSSDIDVIGPSGELIAVGGPAKARDLSKLGSQLKVLEEAAAQRGVTAKAAFERGTPQSAIDLAIRRLGAENVIVFEPEGTPDG